MSRLVAVLSIIACCIIALATPASADRDSWTGVVTGVDDGRISIMCHDQSVTMTFHREVEFKLTGKLVTIIPISEDDGIIVGLVCMVEIDEFGDESYVVMGTVWYREAMVPRYIAPPCDRDPRVRFSLSIIIGGHHPSIVWNPRPPRPPIVWNHAPPPLPHRRPDLRPPHGFGGPPIAPPRHRADGPPKHQRPTVVRPPGPNRPTIQPPTPRRPEVRHPGPKPQAPRGTPPKGSVQPGRGHRGPSGRR